MRSPSNLSRRILVVHADPHARRRLALVLVEAGYDVRLFDTREPALEGARGEWFDLAVVDYALPSGEGFAFASALRQIQPTLPVIMVLPQLELPLIIQGIRQGLTDVLAAEADPRPILRRVHALLRPAAMASGEPTADELQAVEQVLAVSEPAPATEGAEQVTTALDELRAQLAAANEVRVSLAAELERLKVEKAAAEAQLQVLATQHTQGMAVQADVAALKLQEHQSAPVPGGTVSKYDVSTSATAIPVLHSRDPFVGPRSTYAAERAHLEAIREDLREEECRLREEETRLRQEAAQLAIERRRWHEELEQLREREENLRTYEQRLRDQQAQVEKARIALGMTPEAPANPAGVAKAGPLNDFLHRDQKLRAEWERVHRANELLEAERAVFRDERMALRDLEQTIRVREARLREVEKQLAAHEALRANPPSGSGESRGMLKALSRGPFHLWNKSGQ